MIWGMFSFIYLIALKDNSKTSAELDNDGATGDEQIVKNLHMNLGVGHHVSLFF